MRVRVENLDKVTTVNLTGDEPWIAQIANILHQGEGSATARISGQIELRKDSAGFVYGKGHFSHTPILSCSRCAKDVPWPMDVAVNVTWRPPFEGSTPRELSLSAEDLDVYFIENGELDLEELVNDALQCAVPSRVLKTVEGSDDDCGVCGINLSDDLVAGKHDDSSNSPFAILKNLKN